MGLFTHSVLIPNVSISAGDITSEDLPVNPLSFALVTVKFAQNLANTQAVFANIAALLAKMEVLYKGSEIFSASGLDCYAVGLFVCGFESWGVNAKGDDNELRSFTFLVPLGRRMYDGSECFPETRRGELVLQLTWAASFTNIDGVSLQVETVELPGARPGQYLKVTSKSVTPTATGEFDVDLPIGNRISDLVLFGTTIPAGATATKTIQELEIRKNNSEHMYSRSYFESLHNMAGRVGRAPGYWGSHIHQYDAASYAQYADVSPNKAHNHVLCNHVLVPFDVLRDGQYMLETAEATSLVVRINAGDTNAVRVVPCEVVRVSGGGAPGAFR